MVGHDFFKALEDLGDLDGCLFQVRGDYNIAGSNHNKPAYKKEQKALCGEVSRGFPGIIEGPKKVAINVP